MRKKQDSHFVVSAIGALIGALSTASAVAGIGTAASAIGTGASLIAQRKQAAAAEAAADASRRAELIRKQQMEEEARKKNLATMRQNIINIGRANSNVELGGLAPGSSAAGAAGANYATAATDFSSTNTGLGFGQQLFDANAQFSEARGQADYYGGLGNMFADLGAAAGPMIKTGASLFDTSGGWQTTTIEGPGRVV